MIIRQKMFNIIKNDLTIGRTVFNLQPMSENEIRNFILEKANDIEEAIQAMISDYQEDDELHLLANPENGMVLEYLYEYVDTIDNLD